jgi:hypothetical protein
MVMMLQLQKEERREEKQRRGYDICYFGVRPPERKGKRNGV